MLKILGRSYSVFHTGAVVFLVALFLNYLTGVSLRNENLMTGSAKYVKTHELVLDKAKVDRALLELNIEYDLRGAFNWSTDMLFLYVTANYENNRHERNEVVVYDKILRNASEAYQPATKLYAKYFLYDYGRSLRNRKVNLKFYYEVVPLGGFIRQFQLSNTQFTLPENYVNLT